MAPLTLGQKLVSIVWVIPKSTIQSVVLLTFNSSTRFSFILLNSLALTYISSAMLENFYWLVRHWVFPHGYHVVSHWMPSSLSLGTPFCYWLPRCQLLPSHSNQLLLFSQLEILPCWRPRSPRSHFHGTLITGVTRRFGSSWVSWVWFEWAWENTVERSQYKIFVYLFLLVFFLSYVFISIVIESLFSRRTLFVIQMSRTICNLNSMVEVVGGSVAWETQFRAKSTTSSKAGVDNQCYSQLANNNGESET